jgi:hypothetical protein
MPERLVPNAGIAARGAPGGLAAPGFCPVVAARSVRANAAGMRLPAPIHTAAALETNPRLSMLPMAARQVPSAFKRATASLLPSRLRPLMACTWLALGRDLPCSQ